MDSETSNIVGVSFERGDLLVRIVVEGAQLKVVRASDEPLLSRNKMDTSNGDISNFERLDDSSGFMVVDLHGAVVQSDEDPWLSWMKVDRLDPIRPSE